MPRILPPGAAADRTCNGVSKRAEIDVLRRAAATFPPTAPLMIWMIQIDE